MSKSKKVKQRNFVQMHVMEFNTAKVFIDRKKEFKKGYKKHKAQYEQGKDFHYEGHFLLVA